MLTLEHTFAMVLKSILCLLENEHFLFPVSSQSQSSHAASNPSHNLVAIGRGSTQGARSFTAMYVKDRPNRSNSSGAQSWYAACLQIPSQ